MNDFEMLVAGFITSSAFWAAGFIGGYEMATRHYEERKRLQKSIPAPPPAPAPTYYDNVQVPPYSDDPGYSNPMLHPEKEQEQVKE